MKVNEHKQKRQLIGIDKWRRSKSYGSDKSGWGAFWWPTGMGKTYAACMIINTICAKKDGKVFIQVPGIELERQWKAEVAHLVEEQYQHRIIIKVVHSVHSEQIIYNDILLHIADEVHEYLSEKFYTTIDGTLINRQYFLPLTATWIDKEGRHTKLNELCPIVDTITEEDAIDNGWISKFAEYNLAVKLTDYEQERYDYLSAIIREKHIKFDRNMDVIKLCTFGGKRTKKNGEVVAGNAMYFATGWAIKKGWRNNLNLSDTDQYEIDQMWNPGSLIGHAKDFWAAVKERKDILYNTKDKVKVTIQLLQKYDTLKTICFSQSTNFADTIAEAYTEETNMTDIVTYHSNLKSRTLTDTQGNYILYKSGAKIGQPKIFGATSLLKMATDRIRSGDARVITTASALDRGFDVKDIRLGITTSGTSNPTQYKQRGGRVKRIESYQEDIIVLLVNLYVPDTKDESWLTERQKLSDNIVYWVDNINEINYMPK